jgi:hypothetical protein
MLRGMIFFNTNLERERERGGAGFKTRTKPVVTAKR